MIVYDVAVVRQVLKTTCTISIWILAFAGPKKWRFPIQYWIFLKKYPSKQQVHIPKKIEEKHQINQINQIKSVYSTFKRMAIFRFQEGGKMKHPDFQSSPLLAHRLLQSRAVHGKPAKSGEQRWFLCANLHGSDSNNVIPIQDLGKTWKVQSLSRYGELVSFQNLINIGVHMSMWSSFSGGYCQGTEHFYVT